MIKIDWVVRNFQFRPFGAILWWFFGQFEGIRLIFSHRLFFMIHSAVQTISYRLLKVHFMIKIFWVKRNFQFRPFFGLFRAVFAHFKDLKLIIWHRLFVFLFTQLSKPLVICFQVRLYDKNWPSNEESSILAILGHFWPFVWLLLAICMDRN